MKLSIITPTRNRPVALAITQRWVLRAMKVAGVDFEWLLINDGTLSYIDVPRCISQVRRDPTCDVRPSLNCNILQGLSMVTGDVVFICEDDDWFHPTYFKRLLKVLEDYPLAGVAPALYYNVHYRRARAPKGRHHASLGATAFRASMIPKLKNACRCNKPFFDLRFWRQYRESHIGKWQSTLLRNVKQKDGTFLHVGLKGLPGQRGYGIGHRNGGKQDPDLKLLKFWIGKDADKYARFHHRIVSQPLPID